MPKRRKSKDSPDRAWVEKMDREHADDPGRKDTSMRQGQMKQDHFNAREQLKKSRGWSSDQDAAFKRKK